MRGLRLYGNYLAMSIKSKLAYKGDIAVGAVSFIISNVVSFLTLRMTIGIVELDTWAFNNLIFLYAFSLIPKSIDHMFTDNIWGIGTHFVTKGEIDKYLTKPVNPLMQLIGENFCTDGLGELILGIVFLCIYIPLQSIVWSFQYVMALIICAFFAIFLFTAVKLFTATLSFWIKRSIAIMNTVYNMCDFARYPIDLFGKVVKSIMFYIVPFGLMLFLPIQHVLFGSNSLTGTNLWLLVGIISGASMLLLFLSYRFWLFGLKKYESAGS